MGVPDEAQRGDEIEIRDAGVMIRVTVKLADGEPARVLAAFTDAQVLQRWWGGELTADLRPGGEYSVWFPAIPARMTGQVISYVPGRMLQFSWSWQGQPGQPASAVTVLAEPDPVSGGTVLTIEHGPHAADEAGQTARAEHRAGWEYFMPRLAGALSSD